MHPFDVKIEPRAVVIRGQVGKRTAYDALERLAGRHLRGQAGLGRSRPGAALGQGQRIGEVSFGADVQAAVGRIAEGEADDAVDLAVIVRPRPWTVVLLDLERGEQAPAADAW